MYDDRKMHQSERSEGEIVAKRRRREKEGKKEGKERKRTAAKMGKR